MITLTKHFRKRWEERVGPDAPTGRDIMRFVRQGVQLQKYRKVYTPRGREIIILAMYWVQDKGLVIKVDEWRKQAVTVLTEKMERP